MTVRRTRTGRVTQIVVHLHSAVLVITITLVRHSIPAMARLALIPGHVKRHAVCATVGAGRIGVVNRSAALSPPPAAIETSMTVIANTSTLGISIRRLSVGDADPLPEPRTIITIEGCEVTVTRGLATAGRNVTAYLRIPCPRARTGILRRTVLVNIVGRIVVTVYAVTTPECVVVPGSRISIVQTRAGVCEVSISGFTDSMAVRTNNGCSGIPRWCASSDIVMTA